MKTSHLSRWFLLAALGAAQLLGQTRAERNKPFPPHKVIGNIYFVGTDNLGSFLITTPQGNILINSDYEETVPIVRASIEKLGFRYADIKILLGSHAHGDHMEGDALVKELTGARVMAMQQDVDALTAMKPGGKPHPIDQVLHDGEDVKFGDTTLTAHLTPGHTKGCTTWTTKVQDGGKTYDVLILCSVGVNAGVQLVNSPTYPQIADDYMRSFKILKGLHCDVFLGAHTNFYNMQEKYAKLGKGGANPFIDAAGYQSYLEMMEKTFQGKLEEQKR
ncbi:MAG TPA: subclass B3 metallo-beta-lactamase, partial [Bryobacteraceae bacterium]|nr:subclass B3 metallo-beta-lactamase [Bryobacteraceae bacterium]